jgi:hypothetical protein
LPSHWQVVRLAAADADTAPFAARGIHVEDLCGEPGGELTLRDLDRFMALAAAGGGGGPVAIQCEDGEEGKGLGRAGTLIAAWMLRGRRFGSSVEALAWLRIAVPGRAIALEDGLLRQGAAAVVARSLRRRSEGRSTSFHEEALKSARNLGSRAGSGSGGGLGSGSGSGWLGGSGVLGGCGSGPDGLGNGSFRAAAPVGKEVGLGGRGGIAIGTTALRGGGRTESHRASRGQPEARAAGMEGGGAAAAAVGRSESRISTEQAGSCARLVAIPPADGGGGTTGLSRWRLRRTRGRGDAAADGPDAELGRAGGVRRGRSGGGGQGRAGGVGA